MNYDDPNMNYVERLKHADREANRQRKRRTGDRQFVVRQLLNAVFILLAIAAMVGLAMGWTGQRPTWTFHVMTVAIIIKMVEAAIRMPNMMRKPQQPKRNKDAQTPDSPSNN